MLWPIHTSAYTRRLAYIPHNILTLEIHSSSVMDHSQVRTCSTSCVHFTTLTIHSSRSTLVVYSHLGVSLASCLYIPAFSPCGPFNLDNLTPNTSLRLAYAYTVFTLSPYFSLARYPLQNGKEETGTRRTGTRRNDYDTLG